MRAFGDPLPGSCPNCSLFNGNHQSCCPHSAESEQRRIDEHHRAHREMLDAHAQAEAEQLRQERHHEVLCVALGEYLRAHITQAGVWPWSDVMRNARAVADYHYPKPKDPDAAP